MAVITDEAGSAILDEAGSDIYDEAGGSLPPGVTEATFSGPEALVYPTYIDAIAGSTLVAQPGQQYEVEPPPGTGQPAVPDDGNWTAD